MLMNGHLKHQQDQALSHPCAPLSHSPCALWWQLQAGEGEARPGAGRRAEKCASRQRWRGTRGSAHGAVSTVGKHLPGTDHHQRTCPRGAYHALSTMWRVSEADKLTESEGLGHESNKGVPTASGPPVQQGSASALPGPIFQSIHPAPGP